MLAGNGRVEEGEERMGSRGRWQTTKSSDNFSMYPRGSWVVVDFLSLKNLHEPSATPFTAIAVDNKNKPNTLKRTSVASTSEGNFSSGLISNFRVFRD